MDMDRPPYRSLYSVILFQVMTPISITTQYWPCQLDRGPIDCALPRNTGVFHNTTPNKLFLQKCTCRTGVEPASPTRRNPIH